LQFAVAVAGQIANSFKLSFEKVRHDSYVYRIQSANSKSGVFYYILISIANLVCLIFISDLLSRKLIITPDQWNFLPSVSGMVIARFIVAHVYSDLVK
jgi:hypothetical protein